MREEYRKLLLKYAGNKEIYRLIELCKLDNFRTIEEYFQINKKYPDTRDCLGKLFIDLMSARYKIEVAKKNK